MVVAVQGLALVVSQVVAVWVPVARQVVWVGALEVVEVLALVLEVAGVAVVVVVVGVLLVLGRSHEQDTLPL